MSAIGKERGFDMGPRTTLLSRILSFFESRLHLNRILLDLESFQAHPFSAIRL
jgi:hypothetical protein